MAKMLGTTLVIPLPEPAGPTHIAFDEEGLEDHLVPAAFIETTGREGIIAGDCCKDRRKANDSYSP